MVPGVFAAVTFLLFTGVGALAQVQKLRSRESQWHKGELSRHQIYDGLQPVREVWSFTAFSLFALSGLTRSYLDFVLLFSRLPVICLSTVVLWYLARHQAPSARRFFIFALIVNMIIILMVAAKSMGADFTLTGIPLLIDLSLSVVSVLLFFGKMTQAQRMYVEKRSAAVSWMREVGLVLKDLSGIWYALSVGPELLLVGITHTFSVFSSGTICVVKCLLEQRSKKSMEPPASKHQNAS